MAETKSRYIEYRPDEYIAGVAAKLTFEEQGIYWMVCSLIMSNGGPIENDIEHIANLGRMTKTKAKNYSKGHVLRYPNAEEAKIAMEIHDYIGSYYTPHMYSSLKEVYD